LIQVDQFRSGQRVLSQQRYQFPHNWLYSENIDGEWGAMCDILDRKDAAIQCQACSLSSGFVQ
jgi:dynein heavy chain 1